MKMPERQTILGLIDSIGNKELRCVDIVQQYLDRIQQLDKHLNCFREVYAERALDQARKVDKQIEAGKDVGPLAGLPIAIKDNIVTEFGKSSCGSRFLENYKSPFTSTAASRLINSGAIIIGKTNCDEFAMGSSNEHCAFGIVHNPWDANCVPGGSSGGSAAAVAAGLCPAALGSDTGGSIRQPAAFCNVVGAKPTYGRVSRYGLAAFGSSLDQIGPITQDVKDAAMLLKILAGADEHDSTSAQLPVPDYLEQIDTPIAKLRVGIPKQYISENNSDAVNQAVKNAIEVFRNQGAEIVDIDMPLTEYGVAAYYVIAPAEASSNLARYDGIRFGNRAEIGPDENLIDLYEKSRSQGFGPEVKRRIMLGTFVLSAGYYDAYYKRAMQVRRLIKQEYDSAFTKCDILLGPTAPTSAFEIGEKADPLSMYLGDVYTAITNIAGICAISLPGGFQQSDDRSLPIGIQIQCNAFDEQTMFRAARMFESQTDFHKVQPELAKTGNS